MEPYLRLINISKSFGTLPALRQVSFEVTPGEVVGLAGQSGAGKTVLATLLAGLATPDSGDVYVDGQRRSWPLAARQLGIEVVLQKPELANALDVGSNLFLGRETGRPAWGAWLRPPDRRRMERETAAILAELELDGVSPRDKVANLSSEQRQIVALGRALIGPARLVVVDEPTVLLGYAAQQRLLALIQRWRHQGTAVIFASDNLDHLFAVADRICVLRQGQLVATRRTDTTSREEIVSLLVHASERQPLTPAIWALDSYYRAREQAEQLRAHEQLLERSLAVQDSLNRQLIARLSEQVTALDRANLSLLDAQRRLQTEREDERKHLARELHDQVIQDLLSINYQLEDVTAEADTSPAMQAELGDIRRTIRALVDELRHICGDLRPPTIDSLGLGAAIKSFARDWSERSGIALEIEIDPQLGRIPEAIELSLFRIVQESLSNVRKHAHARQVRISLRHTTPRSLMLTVADDGRGLPTNFDLAALAGRGHYGMLGIGERVALFGGRLHVQNQPGGGMQLHVEIPHPRVELQV